MKEGHAAVTLPKSGWAVLIGGFIMQHYQVLRGAGLSPLPAQSHRRSSLQDVCVASTSELVEGLVSFRVLTHGRQREDPITYGHAATSVDDDRTIAVFGGCTQGGHGAAAL
jgi:hypothetical protein